MESLPIFLDKLVPSWATILVSVTLILMFGEIIPQAICTCYGLTVGATVAPLVQLLLSDCGAFVCTLAEYVIHGRDIPKYIDIGYVRMRYGAFSWDYGKRKLEAGIKDNTTEKVGRLFGKEKRKRMH
ncbi:hypothetical protein T459_19827 [Capsicum annuum]|uniref:CNNM transmembrane domain-containing protein n=1 Tax=Capsicum annuum TaxID=4072 RepID=A0A2G2Z366_CAPAN|nr:hypothetical protein T459_19827 [Capsicum annuum]